MWVGSGSGSGRTGAFQQLFAVRHAGPYSSVFLRQVAQQPHHPHSPAPSAFTNTVNQGGGALAIPLIKAGAAFNWGSSLLDSTQGSVSSAQRQPPCGAMHACLDPAVLPLCCQLLPLLYPVCLHTPATEKGPPPPKTNQLLFHPAASPPFRSPLSPPYTHTLHWKGEPPPQPKLPPPHTCWPC